MNNKYLGRTSSRRFTVGGVNVFEFKWHTTGEVFTVCEPEKGKIYSLDAYYISTLNGNIYFIAGKDENHDYLFFEYGEE